MADGERSDVVTAAGRLEGMTIAGVRRPGNWNVVSKILRTEKSSGGSFSVGYVVKHDDGTDAFMKATDFSLLRASGTSFADQLRDAANSFSFERRILELCHGNNMDRIVVALDSGELILTDSGVQEVVFALMFEPAQGDVRSQADREKRYNFVWSAHALHNLSVALQQLHAAKLAHNDVKPSNLLVFEEFLQKLCDLGRAVTAAGTGPYDAMLTVGDQTYAPPELLYNLRTQRNVLDPVQFDIRRTTDLYLLGSMGFHFITGQMLTPLIVSFLNEVHRPDEWTGTYEDVLPFWQNGYAEALQLLEDELPRGANGALTDTAGRLLDALTWLCDPDPNKRGFRTARSAANDFGLERYVALFNHIRDLESLYLRR